eukprot:3485166-Rhodomonas_salina.1
MSGTDLPAAIMLLPASRGSTKWPRSPSSTSPSTTPSSPPGLSRSAASQVRAQAMSGTDIAYHHTRCPVLSSRIIGDVWYGYRVSSYAKSGTGIAYHDTRCAVLTQHIMIRAARY